MVHREKKFPRETAPQELHAELTIMMEAWPKNEVPLDCGLIFIP